jgi:putative transposase
MKKRFSEEQIVRILREAENGTQTIKDIAKANNITEQTFYKWRRKYGGMDVSDVRKLKNLEQENSKLKKLLAEQMLINEALKEINEKKW